MSQLVELKNGEAYNGRMEACDTWMNMHLHEVICTAKDGEKFWRMKEVYIRGNTIKYVRVPDDTLGKAVEEKNRRTGMYPTPQYRPSCAVCQFKHQSSRMTWRQVASSCVYTLFWFATWQQLTHHQ